MNPIPGRVPRSGPARRPASKRPAANVPNNVRNAARPGRHDGFSGRHALFQRQSGRFLRRCRCDDRTCGVLAHEFAVSQAPEKVNLGLEPLRPDVLEQLFVVVALLNDPHDPEGHTWCSQPLQGAKEVEQVLAANDRTDRQDRVISFGGSPL